jgi:sugar phosphate permease
VIQASDKLREDLDVTNADIGAALSAFAAGYGASKVCPVLSFDGTRANGAIHAWRAVCGRRHG